MKDQKKNKERRKKRQSQLEAFVLQIMEKSMKETLNKAMDDLFRDWK